MSGQDGIEGWDGWTNKIMNCLSIGQEGVKLVVPLWSAIMGNETSRLKEQVTDLKEERGLERTRASTREEQWAKAYQAKDTALDDKSTELQNKSNELQNMSNELSAERQRYLKDMAIVGSGVQAMMFAVQNNVGAVNNHLDMRLNSFSNALSCAQGKLREEKVWDHLELNCENICKAVNELEKSRRAIAVELKFREKQNGYTAMFKYTFLWWTQEDTVHEILKKMIKVHFVNLDLLVSSVVKSLKFPYYAENLNEKAKTAIITLERHKDALFDALNEFDRGLYYGESVDLSEIEKRLKALRAIVDRFPKKTTLSADAYLSEMKGQVEIARVKLNELTHHVIPEASEYFRSTPIAYGKPKPVTGDNDANGAN